MKIMVIGADGQLGTDLCKVIPQEELIPLTLKELDITDLGKTMKVIQKESPQIVIDTAAYNQVDNAETNFGEALAINAVGARNVAVACLAANSALVHYSTDYVFDGDKFGPYTELDQPAPQTAYGVSKYAGELAVKYTLEKHFIIRSCGLFGIAGCMGKGGGNFVENIIKKAALGKDIPVVNDERVSPTYTFDLAKKTYELMLSRNYGLYHIVNHGECSWYEFADKIIEYAGLDVKLLPVSSKDLIGKARRPRNSVMINSKLAELGMDDLPDWKEALKAYLAERK
jgi:dTDP-4-dehydrorhamnose reductase